MRDKEVILIESKIGSMLRSYSLKSVYELLFILEKSINTIMDSVLNKIEIEVGSDISKEKKIRGLLTKAEHHKDEFIKLMNRIKKEMK